MLQRISDEEISERWHFFEHAGDKPQSWHDRFRTLKGICDAQLKSNREEHDRVVREIFEEIEKLWQDCDYICHIPLKDYQALKQKYLGGEKP